MSAIAYFLPVREADGLTVAYIGTSLITGKASVRDQAGVNKAIQNSPNVFPITGGHFPVTTQGGAVVLIPFATRMDDAAMIETWLSPHGQEAGQAGVFAGEAGQGGSAVNEAGQAWSQPW